MPDDDDIAMLKHCRYFGCTLVSDETMTALIAYCEFTEPVRMSAIRNVLGSGHISVARATHTQNIEYMTRHGDKLTEWGTPGPGQGTDLKRKNNPPSLCSDCGKKYNL